MTSYYEGGCFCRGVRFRLTGPISQACYCHCESCRRAAGAPYVAWCTVDRERFELIRGELVLHASSPRVARGFCGSCGTSITYAHEERRDIDITIATLDEPERVVPSRHLWIADKLPWVEIGDGLPQFDEFSGG